MSIHSLHHNTAAERSRRDLFASKWAVCVSPAGSRAFQKAFRLAKKQKKTNVKLYVTSLKAGCIQTSSLFPDYSSMESRGFPQLWMSLSVTKAPRTEKQKKKTAVIRPSFRNELWANIFYIITGIQSIHWLIKGGEYWVKAPTAHQLLVPHEVDSHNTSIIHQKFVTWTEALNYLEAGQSRRITLRTSRTSPPTDNGHPPGRTLSGTIY